MAGEEIGGNPNFCQICGLKFKEKFLLNNKVKTDCKANDE